MGVCVHYWAIPPNSRLYARLREDRGFNVLMASLFPYGCGVYHLCEMEPEEVEGILDDIIESHEAVLGPETEARQRIMELLAELERTCAEFPGIERRRSMIEKRSSDIEERLTQAFQNFRTDAAELVSRITFGDKLLAADLRQPGEDINGLVSLPVVREGAAALELSGPEREPDRILAVIASHLGIDVASLCRDPVFRHEVGADELDRLEKLLDTEDAASLSMAPGRSAAEEVPSWRVPTGQSRTGTPTGFGSFSPRATAPTRPATIRGRNTRGAPS
jgi:hypothetical protein